MAITLGGVTLPWPKRASPVLEYPNREMDRAITGAPLLYEYPLGLMRYRYEWDPVGSTDKDTLQAQYIDARYQKVQFVPLEGGGPYYAYTMNWSCRYLTRTASTFLYAVSFDIIVTEVSVG